MVLQEAGSCSGSGLNRLISGWDHISYHGNSLDSRGRLRLDNAYLRIPDSCARDLCKPYSTLPHPTVEEAVQSDRVHPPISRASVRSVDSRYLFLLL